MCSTLQGEVIFPDQEKELVQDVHSLGGVQYRYTWTGAGHIH